MWGQAKPLDGGRRSWRQIRAGVRGRSVVHPWVWQTCTHGACALHHGRTHGCTHHACRLGTQGSARASRPCTIHARTSSRDPSARTSPRKVHAHFSPTAHPVRRPSARHLRPFSNHRREVDLARLTALRWAKIDFSAGLIRCEAQGTHLLAAVGRDPLGAHGASRPSDPEAVDQTFQACRRLVLDDVRERAGR